MMVSVGTSIARLTRRYDDFPRYEVSICWSGNAPARRFPGRSRTMHYRSLPGFPICRNCWMMWNGRGSFPTGRGSMSQSGIGSSSNASGSISKSSRIQQRGNNTYVKQSSIHLEWDQKQTGE